MEDFLNITQGLYWEWDPCLTLSLESQLLGVLGLSLSGEFMGRDQVCFTGYQGLFIFTVNLNGLKAHLRVSGRAVPESIKSGRLWLTQQTDPSGFILRHYWEAGVSKQWAQACASRPCTWTESEESIQPGCFLSPFFCFLAAMMCLLLSYTFSFMTDYPPSLLKTGAHASNPFLLHCFRNPSVWCTSN